MVGFVSMTGDNYMWTSMAWGGRGQEFHISVTVKFLLVDNAETPME